MEGLRTLTEEFSVEDIDRELIARGAQIPEKERFQFKDSEGTPEREAIMEQMKTLYDTTPDLSPNPDLSHICTADLLKMLIKKTQQMNNSRGIWFTDARMDIYELMDEDIRKNAASVAAVCMKDNLIDENNGYSTLKVKNYGKTFSLCDYEPFNHQPIAAGKICTGFLVEKNMIATAGHFVTEKNAKNLRIVFGFIMEDSCTPVIRVANDNIYEAVEVMLRYNRMANGADWALVKLDREVEGHPAARLSLKRIFSDQPVYVIGHPAGLPLKYAPGAQVQNVNGTYFRAKLDIYSSNSGSPVFGSDTHEVIGMVVNGDNRDFRYTGKCWVSVIYPDVKICSEGAKCTRVSEFAKHCPQTKK